MRQSSTTDRYSVSMMHWRDLVAGYWLLDARCLMLVTGY
jgi:hypothetical protein